MVGVKDRATKRVRAQVITRTDAPTLQGFVVKHTAPDATVYTDEASAYEGLPMMHEAVKHSVKEYVRGQVHTNGAESFWSMLKRGYVGIYHKMSPKHLDRYVTEFEGRHNIREQDTIDQMGSVVVGMGGKATPVSGPHRRQRTTIRSEGIGRPLARRSTEGGVPFR